jgi:hypothetical protein
LKVLILTIFQTFTLISANLLKSLVVSTGS